jgi:hypothetical protein
MHFDFRATEQSYENVKYLKRDWLWTRYYRSYTAEFSVSEIALSIRRTDVWLPRSPLSTLKRQPFPYVARPPQLSNSRNPSPPTSKSHSRPYVLAIFRH